MGAVKKYIILPVTFFLFSLAFKAQVISPITFTMGGPQTPSGHINGLAEDSIADRIYFKISCNCGPVTAAKWNAISYIDLSLNQYVVPYGNYYFYGSELRSRGMQFDGNGLNLNDGNYFWRFNTPSYSSAWTYTPAPSETVVATTFRNDSVFTITDDGGWCQRLEIRNRNTGALIPFNTISCTSGTVGAIFGDVKIAKLQGNNLYLAGYFTSQDVASNPLPASEDNVIGISLSTGSFVPLHFSVNDSIKDMEIYNGKIYLAGNFTSVKGQPRNHFAVLDLAGNLLNNTPSYTGGNVEEIVIYDNYVFALGKYTTINSTVVNASGDFILKAADLNTNAIKNWNMPFSVSPLPNDQYMMENFRNRLLVASKEYGYWYVDGYCLPPVKSTSVISTATTSVCENSTVSFSIAPFLYASSYNWTYSGAGASVSPSNNIASINFGTGATSGKVKVWANSACGGQSDTVSLNITILPRPNATASLIDDTLNCFKPKVPILGNSTTAGVGYAWSGPSSFSSIQKNDSTGKYIPGAYTLTVTTLATGCTKTASVLVKLDTVKPNMTLPPGPYQISCSPPVITLNGSSTTTPTVLYWHYQSASTLTPNPYTTGLTGLHYFSVYNTYNGCRDSTSINVTGTSAQPTVSLSSHTYSNALIPVDSITCLTTSVTLLASFTPTNCSIVWKDNSSYTLSANPVTVFGQSYQKAIVTRLDNNCVDSSLIVFVKQNITKPNIVVLTPNPNINCSNSSATLSAAFNPTTASAQWTGPSSFISSNPAITTVQGKYYFTVTRPDNGCSKKDSAIVGYNNSLVVQACKDTTVCKGSTANLNAVVVGTVSSLTYTWSSGAGGQNISVNPVLTSTYVVTASGPAACVGYDTVIVNIPPDIVDSIVTAKSCSGNNGSISVYASGGIPPYKYSLDGNPFSSQSTFTNLPFATYTVIIKDSLACTRSNTADLNQSSNSIAPVFIASTQNFKGDTVVFIDLTVPRADSVNWILPSVASIIGGDMFDPVVVFSDTGSFPVTLQAFYTGCMTSSTKIIKIIPADSAYATLTNANGIRILNLYPNPNTGQFTVQLEFYKKQNCSVQVWDSSPQKYFQQNFLEADVLNIPVNISQLQNGTYILRVTGEYTAKTVYFVISK